MIEYTKKRGSVVMIESECDWIAQISPPASFEPLCSATLHEMGNRNAFYVNIKEMKKLLAFLSAVLEKMNDIQATSEDTP